MRTGAGAMTAAEAAATVTTAEATATAATVTTADAAATAAAVTGCDYRCGCAAVLLKACANAVVVRRVSQCAWMVRPCRQHYCQQRSEMIHEFLLLSDGLVNRPLNFFCLTPNDH
ncbi:MAG: hypothetical protein ACXVCS_08365 [Bdellovibrionota bacterium]